MNSPPVSLLGLPQLRLCDSDQHPLVPGILKDVASVTAVEDMAAPEVKVGDRGRVAAPCEIGDVGVIEEPA